LWKMRRIRFVGLSFPTSIEETAMKNFGIVCAALVIAASLVASASAADRAVSKSTLSSMGLSSMRQLSDADGLAIRGKGTSASVWGESTASFPGQTSTNGYQAAADHHHSSSSAAGGSISAAGVVTGGHHGVSFVVGVAGGASFASAH
jgi:hypothetical protein